MEEKDFREFERNYRSLKSRTDEMIHSLKIPAKVDELKNLEKMTMSDGFWQNIERASQITQEISRLKKQVEPWMLIQKELSDSMDLLDMAIEENDSSVIGELCEKYPGFESRFVLLENMELLSGEDDDKNAYINIHPGAGGTESQDWANMLLRMYVRWSENHGFSIEIIDYMPGEEAGLKTVTALISGVNVFGLLKSESGIHRLVRISPFDANKRRHTSFAAVDVLPEISEEIDVDINDSEIRIDTYRASGAGGQHVNRTDSAVRITHIPTGIVVQCQNERSQHKNKAFAMKILRSRLYDLRKKEFQEKQMEKSGEKKDISWGNQIRSYVFQPYTLVKDHRTSEETGSIEYVLDGDIDRFIFAYLKKLRNRAD